MGMLDRYKKKGGFIQLLTLIESSNKQKQEQFLQLVAQESPVWEEALKKKTMSIEKILSWDSTYLSEIFSRVQPLTTVVALRNFPPEAMEKILNCFSSSDKRKLQNLISETNPSPAEINTCVMKVLSEVRELMKTGILKMDKIDPELMIPESIEEILNNEQLEKKMASSQPLEFHTDDKSTNGSINSHGNTSGGAAPVSLNFEGPDKNRGTSDLKKTGSESHRASNSDHGREEIEFLKKKVNQLSQENNHLKSELAIFRNKLEQIRKIA